MPEHHGPDGPVPMRAAAVDDAAQALLAAWDTAGDPGFVNAVWLNAAPPSPSR